MIAIWMRLKFCQLVNVKTKSSIFFFNLPGEKQYNALIYHADGDESTAASIKDKLRMKGYDIFISDDLSRNLRKYMYSILSNLDPLADNTILALSRLKASANNNFNVV